MNLEFDQNVHEFFKNAGAALEVDPSVHSFVLSQVVKYRDSGKPMNRLVRGVGDDGHLVAGIQTEKERALLLSKASPEQARALARLLAARVESLPGVNGPSPGVDEFVSAWTAAKRCPSRLATNLRLFELKQVIDPAPRRGAARLAGPQDRELIFRWQKAFFAEAMPHEPLRSEPQLYEDIDDGLRKQQYFLWEDGACVCLVASKRETARERWIAPVYTPVEWRGKGYASALVAHVSREILRSGKMPMLFTDLANPTSNSIYQKVGFRPVADFKHFFFS